MCQCEALLARFVATRWNPPDEPAAVLVLERDSTVTSEVAESGVIHVTFAR
jgi:hypothetical protein